MRLWIIVLIATALALACAQRRIPAASRGQATIVLLPDPESGALGSATVSNTRGTVGLSAAREATTAAATRPPAPARVMPDSEVQTVFGGVLSAQPPPPLHFVVYFRFESDDLADESRQSIPDVLRQIAARSFPDVTVVGHTDTTGDRAANFQLGLDRAMRVRRLLVEAGLDASLIEVISHGETDLLVPTPDETSEPRNRRVEIAVR